MCIYIYVYYTHILHIYVYIYIQTTQKLSDLTKAAFTAWPRCYGCKPGPCFAKDNVWAVWADTLNPQINNPTKLRLIFNRYNIYIYTYSMIGGLVTGGLVTRCRFLERQQRRESRPNREPYWHNAQQWSAKHSACDVRPWTACKLWNNN